jgi:hypothetical protein|tara:strand:+ start:1728 stop:2171 length:444 start_codon:yes stop_codon:yes gene_type:complete
MSPSNHTPYSSNFNSNSDYYYPDSSKSNSQARFNPKEQTPREKQSQVFSRDWRKHNPWMEGIVDEKPIDLSGFCENNGKIDNGCETNISKRVGICINFSDGIPLDNFVNREVEKVALMKKKASDLAIFNEMMKESQGISRIVSNYNK